MCFVWIWEQTAIISLYIINWLVFITGTECVYCAVRSTFYVLPTHCIYVFCVDLRTNSDYFTVQHWLVGFYNWDGVCLLRGTDWVYMIFSLVSVCQCIFIFIFIFILSFLHFGAVPVKCQLLCAVAMTRCILGEQRDLQIHRVRLFDITTRQCWVHLPKTGFRQL